MRFVSSHSRVPAAVLFILAAAIAAAMHVRLGALLNVTSPPRTDKQQIIVSGSRISRANSLPAIAVPIVPEPITTTSYVTVAYAVIQ